MRNKNRQKEIRLYRGHIPSPGRPGIAWREDRVKFWDAIARGLKSDEAGVESGVSSPVDVSVVQARWWGEPLPASNHIRTLYVILRARDIAIWHATKIGVREMARRLKRDPSTISRELLRNASSRSYPPTYEASTAQWHAERRARRPMVAKLATNNV